MAQKMGYKDNVSTNVNMHKCIYDFVYCLFYIKSLIVTHFMRGPNLYHTTGNVYLTQKNTFIFG